MSRPYNYANLADVQSALPGLALTASSRPNASQVTLQLELASNELDGVLAMLGYSVPVATGATVSMGMLRSWATVGGAYRAAMSMPQGKDSKHAESYGAEWKAILNGLEGARRSLPDAETNPSKLPRGAPPAEDGSGAPIFTRGNSEQQR
jgi:hypothetical protein